MPIFDPTFPAFHSEVTSEAYRNQFNALKELVDAGVPGPQGEKGDKGDQGETGPQGPPFASAVVDGTTTLPPGEAATVSTSFDGSNVHFAFGIPRGDTGTDGADGPPGPPFATAIVDATNTLNPGDNASVDVTFDGTSVHFIFGIPRGADGPPAK